MNYFSRDARSRNGATSEYRAVFFLLLATWFWSIAARLAGVVLFRQGVHVFFRGIIAEFILCALIFGILNILFLRNDRYVDIYIRFKETGKDERRRAMRNIYLFIGLPILLIPILFWWVKK